jgi:hypothetical protein
VSPKGGAALLILVGLSRLVAGEFGWGALDEAAAATGAAPAPARAARAGATAIEWVDHGGGRHEFPLDEAAFRRIRGPGLRRFVFESAIRSDRFTEVWRRTLHHAFCSCAPILVELGLDPKRMAAPPRILFGDKMPVEAPCR